MFRVAETFCQVYHGGMTTAEQFRSGPEAGTARHAHREFVIAGVPWPAYKVVAILLALLVFALVILATADPSAAVLTATAAATTAWIAGGSRHHR